MMLSKQNDSYSIAELTSRIRPKTVMGLSVIFGASLYGYYWYLKRRNKEAIVNLLNNAHIVVVFLETSNLNQLSELLLSHVREQPYLGFDCEWITEGKRRKPVAILQLATYKHFCLILRLNQLPDLPKTIKQILADEKILKVGVAPVHDAQYLYHDYNIETNGCLDLRHLTNETHGLGSLSKKYLGFTMNKHWKIRCSNWEAETLNKDQINYAAQDVIIAVELFKKMRKLSKHETLSYFIDVPFYAKKQITKNKSSLTLVRKSRDSKLFRLSARKSPLYSNCIMLAPDDDVLCTCDKKKAEWYIKKNLANVVSENPFTIKLNFEPTGRAVGEVGKYYTVGKLNRCVVCGCPDSYMRKNVVPREYRKLFPTIMKEHSSHDVLLLCTTCHQRSNICDNVLRNKLVKLCNAPIGADNVKLYDSPAARELKSAAKALLRAADIMPENRKLELNKIILKYFPGKLEITKSMLETAQCVATSVKNEHFEPHGKKVVDYFKSNCNSFYQNELGTGGLTELEQMWREHFLETMRPKYLPEHWSVTHNKHRLEIRAGEGRIDLEDLKIAGCDENLFIPKNIA